MNKLIKSTIATIALSLSMVLPVSASTVGTLNSKVSDESSNITPFATEVGSCSINLKSNDFQGCTGIRYLKVDSGGSITINIDSIKDSSGRYLSSWQMGAWLLNSSTQGETSMQVLTNNKKSYTWTNLKAGNYVIFVKNTNLVTVSGTGAYSWTGTRGPIIE